MYSIDCKCGNFQADDGEQIVPVTHDNQMFMTACRGSQDDICYLTQSSLQPSQTLKAVYVAQQHSHMIVVHNIQLLLAGQLMQERTELHKVGVDTVALHPSQALVATGGADRLIKLWPCHSQVHGVSTLIRLCKFFRSCKKRFLAPIGCRTCDWIHLCCLHHALAWRPDVQV